MTDRFFMGYVRLLHFGFAMTLDVSFLLWFYLFFFSMAHPFVHSIFPLGQRAKEAFQMLCHYFTLRNKPSTTGDSHVDPLNAYGFLLIHLFVFIQMLTGFALMAPTFSAANSSMGIWLTILRVSDSICLSLFSTEVATRQMHHLSGYIILVLAMIHVYIQVWREHFWTEGHISVVVSGYKYIELDK